MSNASTSVQGRYHGADWGEVHSTFAIEDVPETDADPTVGNRGHVGTTARSLPLAYIEFDSKLVVC